MTSENILEKVKKLRELTGVGFKDCKGALEESNGDIEKSIEFLRKKGIAKANKKMERVAADGLVCIYEKNNNISMVELNCETDFVAKNKNFISFAEEISEINFKCLGKINDIQNYEMKNKKKLKDSIVDLISKIGEKITLRRSTYIGAEKSSNFFYVHSSLKENVGKLGVLLSLEVDDKNKAEFNDFGKKLTMQIAASSPLSVDRDGLDKKIIEKEKELITEELKNTGKDSKIINKIAEGKLNKFINDNSLLNQEWIMDPKKKVKDILKEVQGKNKIKINNFFRFKVGEGL